MANQEVCSQPVCFSDRTGTNWHVTHSRNGLGSSPRCQCHRMRSSCLRKSVVGLYCGCDVTETFGTMFCEASIKCNQIPAWYVWGYLYLGFLYTHITTLVLKISGKFPETFHGKLGWGILEIFKIGNLLLIGWNYIIADIFKCTCMKSDCFRCDYSKICMSQLFLRSPLGANGAIRTYVTSFSPD